MAERKNRQSQPARIGAFGARDAGPVHRSGPARVPREKAKPVELHVCEACGSQLVFPTDWEPAGSRHWAVRLRCPDCEWHGEGVYSQDVVDRFDQVLDEGTEAVL